MRYFFQIYFLLLPFQWALSPVPGIDLAIIRLVTVFGAFGFIGWGLWRRQLWFSLDKEVFFLSGFLFLAIFSLVWAENQVFSARKIMFLLSFAPLFFLAVSWLKESSERRSAVLRAYVSGAALLGIVALLPFLAQFVFGVGETLRFLTTHVLPIFLGETFARAVAAYPSLLVNVSGVTLLRASGVFPDPHMFSYYVGMAIPIAYGLFFTETSGRLRWLLMGTLLFIVDLLTFSRGGYVGLFVAASVVLVALLRTLSFRKVGLIIGLTVGVFVLGAVSPLGGRFLSIFSEEDGSNNERLRLWREAVEHIGEQPLLGVGLGNYPLVAKPSAEYREPIYAHSLYLDVTLELGLIGLLSLLGMVAGVCLYLGRAYRQRGDSLALGVLASLMLFLGHSLFETPLFSVHVLPVFLLLLAVGVSYKYHEIS